MDVMVAAKQMFIIFLLIMVGYICNKVKMVSESESSVISKLVVNVFNPALIFTSVLSNANTKLDDSLQTLVLCAIGIFVFLIVTSRFLAQLFRDENGLCCVHEVMFIFSNVGFIGIPVVNALLGSDKLIYVAIVILIYNILIYTYGTYLLQSPSNGSKKMQFHLSDLKPLINPGTVVCLITLVFFMFKIPVPSVLSDGLQYLANATTSLSLFVIGVTLGSQKHLLPLFTNAKRYLFCFLKLLVVPLVGTWLLLRLPVSDTLCQTYMVMLAMPVGNMTLLLMKEAGFDGEEGSYSIVLSTLLSVATIPILVFLYGYL